MREVLRATSMRRWVLLTTSILFAWGIGLAPAKAAAATALLPTW